MNNKNDGKLTEMLKLEGLLLSLTEIEEILNNELEKGPDEMDTALVDACVSTLNKADDNLSENENKEKPLNNKKCKSIRRVILIAAILVIIVSLFAIPTIAHHFHRDVSPDKVSFTDDSIGVNLQEDFGEYKSIDETLKDLENFGFTDIILPAELLSGKYEVAGEYKVDDVTTSAKLVFKKDDKVIKATIRTSQKSNYNFSIGESDLDTKYPCVQEIRTGNIDIIVFGDVESAGVLYYNNGIDYKIHMEMEFNSAVEFAKTIEFANDGE